MNLYTTLALIAALFPLTVYFDYLEKRRVDATENGEIDYNKRNAPMVLMFTPFSMLFYTEQFWWNLLYLLPLYVWFGLVMYIAARKSWAVYFKHDITISGGSGVFVTILAWFIWFHKGALAPETATATAQAVVMWPWYILGGMVLITMVLSLAEQNSTGSKNSTTLVALMMIVFPVLALFSSHFWWMTLAGIIGFMATLTTVASREKPDVGGGMGMAFSYIYMMFMTGSILIYAIFF